VIFSQITHLIISLLLARHVHIRMTEPVISGIRSDWPYYWVFRMATSVLVTSEVPPVHSSPLFFSNFANAFTSVVMHWRKKPGVSQPQTLASYGLIMLFYHKQSWKFTSEFSSVNYWISLVSDSIVNVGDMIRVLVGNSNSGWSVWYLTYLCHDQSSCNSTLQQELGYKQANVAWTITCEIQGNCGDPRWGKVGMAIYALFQ
jgi:hypothetical protein